MGKSKYLCSKCGQKHYPPTGKKCFLQPDLDEQLKCSKISTKKQSKDSLGSEAGELNIHSYSHGSGDMAASSVASTSASGAHQAEDSSEGEQEAEPVQHLILKELQRVNAHLDAVEGQIASTTVQHSPKRHSSKLSSTSGSHKNVLKNLVTFQVLVPTLLLMSQTFQICPVLDLQEQFRRKYTED